MAKPHRKKEQIDREGIRTRLKGLMDDNSDPFQVLEGILADAADPGTDLAWIAAYDFDPSIAECALVLVFLAANTPDVPPADRKRFGGPAGKVLLQALHNPNLSDDRKYALAGLYKRFNDIPDESFRSFFKDLEGTSIRKGKELVKDLADKPEQAEELLASLGFLLPDETPPSEGAFACAVDFCAKACPANPPVVATMLGIVVAHAAAHATGIEQALHALDVLAGIPHERAAWCIAELARWPGMGIIGGKALTLAGALPPGKQPAAPPIPASFCHGTVSGPDGDGSRYVMLSFNSGEEDQQGVVLLINDIQGMKDAWGIYRNAGGIEDEMIDRQPSAAFTECSPDLAREILADTWALHEEQQRPFPGALFGVRPYLGPEPIIPRRRTPDLSAYGLANAPRTPQLVAHCDDLMSIDRYGRLYFVSDAAYDFVGKVGPKKGSLLKANDFQAFVDGVAAPEKATLLSRVSANLEVEALAGRAGERLNGIAARTWLALSENVVPFGDVPYVRSLCRKSVQIILDNLRNGFHSQAEVNEAADREDEERDRLLEKMIGEMPDDTRKWALDDE